MTGTDYLLRYRLLATYDPVFRVVSTHRKPCSIYTFQGPQLLGTAASRPPRSIANELVPTDGLDKPSIITSALLLH